MKKLYLTIFALGMVCLTYGQTALNVDGVDDFASAPNASSLVANADGISLSVWINPTTQDATFPAGIAGFRNESSFDFFLLHLNSSNLEARLRNSTNQYFTITYNGVTTGDWAHYVLTYNGSNLILYKNGLEVDNIAANGTFTIETDPMYIGKTPFFGSDFNFGGDIDEISLWSKGLSADEVLAIYECGVVGTEDGLQIHYKCDEGMANMNNTSITTLAAEVGIDANIMNMTMDGNTSNYVDGDATANQETINPNIDQAGLDLTSQEVADSYQWYHCNDGLVMIDGATEQSYTAETNGYYTVFLESGNCSGYSYCVLVDEKGVSVSDQFIEQVSIYPNPTTIGSGFRINSDETWSLITIRDITGRTMELINVFNPQTEIQTADWSPGIYFVEIQSTKGALHTQRVILK